uniref:Large ribosomal subunit protein uL10 n=2 Tax=Neoaves TaxID=3078114 RepID=A0A8C0ELA8_BUBBB
SQLLDDYPKCFIVGADNVGSKQMQQIRMSLRGKAVVLMGKNTMMRKAIRGHLENNPALEKLLPHIRGNVGFVFTKEDLTEIRDMLLANKVPAAARAGAIAPCDVTVPAQNTGLGPEKTSFFQALGITTKISRGTIEILSDVQLIKTGDKVGASEATLLNMLNISPFSFGLVIQQVFDNGSIYNPEVLDITEETLHKRFLEGVRNVASVCLQIGYPTIASVPHSIINGYKRVLAVAVETDYTFPLAEKVTAESRLLPRGCYKRSQDCSQERLAQQPSLKGLGPARVRGTCPGKGHLLPCVVYKWQEKAELPWRCILAGAVTLEGSWNVFDSSEMVAISASGLALASCKH